MTSVARKSQCKCTLTAAAAAASNQSLSPKLSALSAASGSSKASWESSGSLANQPTNDSPQEDDDLSSIPYSSLSSSGGDLRRQGSDEFQVDLLSSEPEDFDESGHLFHLDILNDSLTDLSISSTRRSLPMKPKSTHNLSFSRERVREIERHNQLLLQRIMTSKPTLQTMPKPNVTTVCTPVHSNSRIASAAVNRKKKQRQIDMDNQLLWKKLVKIQRTRRNAWW